MTEVLEQFLSDLGGDGATPTNTVAAYRTDLKQFVTFLHDHGVADVAALRPEAMQAFCTWLAEHGYAPSTIARRIAALRAFGTYLVQGGVLTANPADGLAGPRRATKRVAPAALAAEDLAGLRAATQQAATPEGWRDRALIELLAATGLRASQAIALDVADLALERSVLTVRDPRTGSRTLALPPEAVMALATYLHLGRPYLLKRESAETALLLNVRGQRLTRQGLWAILQAHARRLQRDGLSLEQLRRVGPPANPTTTG